MIYRNLDDVYSVNHGILTRLRQSLIGLNMEQIEIAPPGGGWTIPQIAEHIAIVDAQMLKLLGILLQKAENLTDVPQGSGSFPIDVEAVVERSRREKYVAPENAQPIRGLAIAGSIAEIEHMNKAVDDMKERFANVNLSSVRFPHWIFGPLTLGEWLAFVGVHEERHLRQIERVISEFPPTGSDHRFSTV